MKNPLIVISLLLIPMLSFSQGIKFEQGTWSDVLAIAKKAHKPIFLDVYTTWCGPCKKMSQDVFPLESVGKVFNSNYICYQIDAERGEGIELAKKYQITAYPTYLFVKADGTVFSRALGSMDSDKFVGISDSALKELNNPKSISAWDSEYQLEKNDPQFLLEYMTKRSHVGLPNIELFNEYLQLIPLTELTSDQVVKLYLKEGKQMKVSDFSFQNLLKNRDLYFAKFYGNVVTLLQGGILNTIKDAAKQKNEEKLESAISAFKQISSKSTQICVEELYMDYFKRTNEVDKYVKYASLFCNQNLMLISPDSISAKDSTNLQKFNQQVRMETLSKIDSSQIIKLKEYIAHAERMRVCDGLNNNAWYFYENISDKGKLENALRWSDRTLVLDPKNVMWMDTNANILYKLGRKDEAIKKENEAIMLCSKDDSNLTNKFKDTLKKMTLGE